MTSKSITWLIFRQRVYGFSFLTGQLFFKSSGNGMFGSPMHLLSVTLLQSKHDRESPEIIFNQFSILDDELKYINGFHGQRVLMLFPYW